MDANIVQRFKDVLQHCNDDLALTFIEHHDQESLRLLWHLPDMPEEVVIPDESLVRLLDKPTWERFSRRLHQSIAIDFFGFTLMSFVGGIFILWGIFEVIKTAQSGGDYLTPYLCLIPGGIMFLLVGGFAVYDARQRLQRMQSPLKKKMETADVTE
jgi:hypothetical protein